MIAFVIQLITFIQNLLPGPIDGKYKKRVNIILSRTSDLVKLITNSYNTLWF
jgi:hypothetical protein